MNVVFIGASRFGLRCLEQANRTQNCNIVGIVTAPQKFNISYKPEGVNNVLHADIASYAKKFNIPCLSIKNGMKDPSYIEVIKTWCPDLFLIVGWYHLIPKSWRQLAPAYGMHASLLPDYSGGAPLVWAMINGETQTGITLFQMDDGVDTGPIVSQIKEHISDTDTISTLYARIEKRGLELLSSSLPKLIDGTATLQEQTKYNRRVMPQRSPEDGLIEWASNCFYIERFVRAQTRPYPGAYALADNTKIIVWSARAIEQHREEPIGTMVRIGAEAGIVCGSGVLILQEIEIAGDVIDSNEIYSKLLPSMLYNK